MTTKHCPRCTVEIPLLAVRCPSCRAIQWRLGSLTTTFVCLLLLGVPVLVSWHAYNAVKEQGGRASPERPQEQDGRVSPDHPPLKELALPDQRKAEKPAVKEWFPVAANPRGGDDGLKAEERAVRNFTADGVSFRTTLAEFNKRGRSATIIGEGMGRSSYAWGDRGGTRYGVTFSIFNVDSLGVVDDETTYDAMLRECNERFGSPSREDKEVGADGTSFYFWDFPAIQRSVALGKVQDQGRVRSYLLVSAAY